MTSFLNLDPPVEQASVSHGSSSSNATAAPSQASASSPAPASDAVPAPPKHYEEPAVDFEIVFGRRQVASTGLLLMVVLACVSGVSYLIGKSTAAKAPAPASVVSAATAAPVHVPASAPPASVKIPAAPEKRPAVSQDQGPLFAEAVTGKVYIQVGAIDKGLAGVWAEGLRTHGLAAFVATGPSDKMWRVLIGPLPEPRDYEQAKSVLDQLGIATFGRKYTDAAH